MTDQPAETINGEKLTSLLRYLIDSRHLCKIMIPNSSYCWITLLSGIQKEGPSNSLLIDGVPGFEQALSQSKGREVVLEYVDSGRVLCHFSARVLKTDLNLKMIWVEYPEVIYRVQRRTFYRLKAPARTEMTFRSSPEKEERAEVLDYSLGGVAILVPRPFTLNANDQLKDQIGRAHV
jgi:c-di-GMP-binding flagellar brake protein YcgR